MSPLSYLYTGFNFFMGKSEVKLKKWLTLFSIVNYAMRYLGSKDSLKEEIIQLLRDKGIYAEGMSFFDAFCGTGAVANAVKDIYNIKINDFLLSSVTYAKGRLLASTCTFEKLGFDPFDYLNGSSHDLHGFIYNTYSPGGSSRMYFTEKNAARIDYFRQQIEQWREGSLVDENEYMYLLSCLLEAVSKVSNTAGVYGAFLKHWDPRSYLDISILPLEGGCVYNTEIEHYNKRVEEIIDSVECDILYLDPPYTQNQYGTQYHLLETIVLNDTPSVSPITGSRPISPLRSEWSKDIYAHILFEKVIATTKAQHVIFSYNNDGFMSKDFIESTMKRFGIEATYECREISYKKYNNFKCSGRDGHVEYLFYIQKKPIHQVVIESPLNYSGSKAKMVDFLRTQFPDDFQSFVDLFGGGFNVGVNVEANHVVYNDINPFVVGLIKSFCDIDTYSYLKYVYKLIRDYSLQPTNSEGYLRLRDKYNSTPISKRDPRMLYTLILFGFQQQIRFNSNHDFNIPCGQRRFNDRLISKFISFSRVMKGKEVVIENTDFRKLLADADPNSFFYLDPPYRETTAAYNDGKRGFEGWTIEHEKAMCEGLDILSLNGGKFLLSYIIDVEGFHNEQIEQWANEKKYQIVQVTSAQGRYNNREEVIIKNY